jgi:hypothetical protein
MRALFACDQSAQPSTARIPHMVARHERKQIELLQCRLVGGRRESERDGEALVLGCGNQG